MTSGLQPKRVGMEKDGEGPGLLKGQPIILTIFIAGGTWEPFLGLWKTEAGDPVRENTSTVDSKPRILCKWH